MHKHCLRLPLIHWLWGGQPFEPYPRTSIAILQLGCESFLLHWSGRTTLDTQSWSLMRKKEGTIYIHFPNTSNNRRYSISTALLWCLDVHPEQKKTVKTPKSQGCFDFNDTPQNASILSEFTLTIFTPGAILTKISSSVQTISVPKKNMPEYQILLWYTINSFEKVFFAYLTTYIIL